MTYNADGDMCPPLVVLPHVSKPASMTDSIPQDWSLAKSETGFMNGAIFEKYVCNDFHNWIIKNKVKKPVVLLVDGYKTHESSTLSAASEHLGIISYDHPLNTSNMHLLDHVSKQGFIKIKFVSCS